jgi:hypothetical protein
MAMDGCGKGDWLSREEVRLGVSSRHSPRRQRTRLRDNPSAIPVLVRAHKFRDRIRGLRSSLGVLKQGSPGGRTKCQLGQTGHETQGVLVLATMSGESPYDFRPGGSLKLKGSDSKK